MNAIWLTRLEAVLFQYNIGQNGPIDHCQNRENIYTIRNTWIGPKLIRFLLHQSIHFNYKTPSNVDFACSLKEFDKNVQTKFKFSGLMDTFCLETGGMTKWRNVMRMPGRITVVRSSVSKNRIFWHRFLSCISQQNANTFAFNQYSEFYLGLRNATACLFSVRQSVSQSFDNQLWTIIMWNPFELDNDHKLYIKSTWMRES